MKGVPLRLILGMVRGRKGCQCILSAKRYRGLENLYTRNAGNGAEEDDVIRRGPVGHRG